MSGRETEAATEALHEEIEEKVQKAIKQCTIEIIAVDPGDAHVGIAQWSRKKGMRSTELDARNALPFFSRALCGRTALIIEEFRLYPYKASAQSWSPMKTAEMIGALKWIARNLEVPVYMQGAYIKEPIRRQCKARNIEWRDAKSIHASDARLHAFYWLLRNEVIE